MKIYCSCCDKVQPVRIDNCRDAKTNKPFQDIMCAECDLVIASGTDIIVPPSLESAVGTAYKTGWEHVSVSRRDRCPTWDEMCLVKSIFWDEDDCVIQYHPPRSEYVNNHPNCLHLWRPIGVSLAMPPSIMVGFKD